MPPVPKAESTISNTRNSSFRMSFAAPPPMPQRPYSLLQTRRSTFRSEKGSALAPPRDMRVRMASTLLEGEIDKPWLREKSPRARISWWLTIGFMIFGVCMSAIQIYTGVKSVDMIKQPLCLVLSDDFNSPQLDMGLWSYDVELGGYG